MNHLQLDAAQRDLWLTRVYYFVSLGGGGFIAPFLNVFYVQIGLSGTDIGLVAAVGSVVALIAAPLWTSGRREQPRRLLQLSLLLTGLSYLWLGAQHLLFWIALITALRALVGAGISPLSDSLALAVTGAHKSGFGSVRVWASLGWIVSVTLGGWLIERLGFGAVFWGVSLTAILGAGFLFPIETRYFVQPRLNNAGRDRLGVTIRALLKNRTMLGVAVTLIIIGMANSGVAQFETVYLSTLGATAGVIGIAGMASAVVEIPCMLWADRLVRQYGAHRLLWVAMGLIVILRGLVLWLPSVATIMAERAIGGIPFSLYVVALTSLISEQTTQDKGTVLALYTVTLTNLVGMVSAPLAGAAYDSFGARWLYAIAVAGYAFGWFILRLTRPIHQTRME